MSNWTPNVSLNELLECSGFGMFSGLFNALMHQQNSKFSDYIPLSRDGIPILNNATENNQFKDIFHLIISDSALSCEKSNNVPQPGILEPSLGVMFDLLTSSNNVIRDADLFLSFSNDNSNVMTPILMTHSASGISNSVPMEFPVLIQPSSYSLYGPVPNFVRVNPTSPSEPRSHPSEHFISDFQTKLDKFQLINEGNVLFDSSAYGVAARGLICSMIGNNSIDLYAFRSPLTTKWCSSRKNDNLSKRKLHYKESPVSYKYNHGGIHYDTAAANVVAPLPFNDVDASCMLTLESNLCSSNYYYSPSRADRLLRISNSKYALDLGYNPPPPQTQYTQYSNLGAGSWASSMQLGAIIFRFTPPSLSPPVLSELSSDKTVPEGQEKNSDGHEEESSDGLKDEQQPDASISANAEVPVNEASNMSTEENKYGKILDPFHTDALRAGLLVEGVHDGSSLTEAISRIETSSISEGPLRSWYGQMYSLLCVSEYHAKERLKLAVSVLGELISSVTGRIDFKKLSLERTQQSIEKMQQQQQQQRAKQKKNNQATTNTTSTTTTKNNNNSNSNNDSIDNKNLNDRKQVVNVETNTISTSQETEYFNENINNSNNNTENDLDGDTKNHDIIDDGATELNEENPNKTARQKTIQDLINLINVLSENNIEESPNELNNEGSLSSLKQQLEHLQQTENRNDEIGNTENQSQNDGDMSDLLRTRRLVVNPPIRTPAINLDHVLLFDVFRGYINPLGLSACFKNASNVSSQQHALYRSAIIRALMDSTVSTKFLRGGINQDEMSSTRAAQKETLKILSVRGVFPRSWLHGSESNFTGGIFSNFGDNPFLIVFLVIFFSLGLIQCCCCMADKEPLILYDTDERRENWMFEPSEERQRRLRERNNRIRATGSRHHFNSSNGNNVESLLNSTRNQNR